MTQAELDQLRREVAGLSPSGQWKLDRQWARKVLAAVEAGCQSESAATREEDVLEVEVPSTETTDEETEEDSE